MSSSSSSRVCQMRPPSFFPPSRKRIGGQFHRFSSKKDAKKKLYRNRAATLGEFLLLSLSSPRSLSPLGAALFNNSWARLVWLPSLPISLPATVGRSPLFLLACHAKGAILFLFDAATENYETAAADKKGLNMDQKMNGGGNTAAVLFDLITT